jgi:hypothetical protein
MNDLIPIEPETSKAIEEVAKVTGQGIEAGTKFLQFWGGVFGTVPHDLIGLIGGDWLHHVRIRHEFKLSQRTQEILAVRGVTEIQAVSEDIARPLLEAAREQGREELQEIWARLLANAADPKNSSHVRKIFIDIIKQFDPLDTRLLQEISKNQNWTNWLTSYAATLSVSEDEIECSLSNLQKTNCISIPVKVVGAGSSPFLTSVSEPNPTLTATGRLLMRAIRE